MHTIKETVWRISVWLYRKLGLLRALPLRPFFKKTGRNFGFESGIYRLSGIQNITIGDNFSLTYGCIFMGDGGIEIGNNVLIGPYSQLYSVDHIDRLDNRKVKTKITIGDNVWIGANTIILKGVTIGRNAVVGAGSLVTRDIPPDSIFAGNPAHFIRKKSTKASSKERVNVF